MSNLLEYTLSINNQMTKHLNTIGISSDSTMVKFKNLERETNEVSQGLNTVGRSAGSLKQRLADLKNQREWIPLTEISKIKQADKEIRNLERSINKLENTSGRGTGNWFKEAFNQIPFANLLTNPLVIAGGIAGASIQKGIQNDLNKSSFEVFLGSEAAADKLMADLSKVKMDKNVLGENAKMMLSFGLDDSKVLPVLSSIGDISAGSADKMSSLTRAFSQMSSLGKLQAEELNQMIDAGYNPLTEMMRTTGKTMTQLREDMAKGNISASMVEKAFISSTSSGGQYHNMLEKMSQTLGGQLNEEMRKMNDRLLTMYNYIEPVVSKMVELGGAALDLAFNGLGWLFDKLEQGDFIAWTVAGALGNLTLSMIALKTATMAQTAWTALSTSAWWANNAAMLANPIFWIIGGVVALIAIIGALIYKIDGWGEAWDHTVNMVKSIWNGYINYVKLGWLSAEHFLLEGFENILRGWNMIKSLWDEDGANAALNEINERSQQRKNNIANTGKEMVSSFKNAWNETKQIGSSFSVNDKTFADFKSDALKTMGMSQNSNISAPTGIPGVSNSSGIQTSLPSNSNNSGSAKSNSAIATGGTKHNYMTFNIDSLVNGFTVNNKTVSESAEDIKQTVQDALLRVLASAESAAG